MVAYKASAVNIVSATISRSMAATGKRVEDAITNALNQIKAIKAPFVKNIKDPQCANAINACKELSDALTAASDFIGKNNK